jgi:hypothetical protein
VKRKSNQPSKHADPYELTLPKYKLVQGEGREWWFEPDGVKSLLDPEAAPGGPPCPEYERERQLLDWLGLARRYSTSQECVDAVQNLLREYRLQIADFRRWRRRTDFVRECWARETQDQNAKPRGEQDNPPPNPALLKPRRRQGERDAVDPRLMQWAGDLGRHILAQSDPVTALTLLLNKKRPANRPTENTERNQRIRSAIVSAKANGASLKNAVASTAMAWGLSIKQVREIYYSGPKAARHSL